MAFSQLILLFSSFLFFCPYPRHQTPTTDVNIPYTSLYVLALRYLRNNCVSTGKTLSPHRVPLFCHDLCRQTRGSALRNTWREKFPPKFSRFYLIYPLVALLIPQWISVFCCSRTPPAAAKDLLTVCTAHLSPKSTAKAAPCNARPPRGPPVLPTFSATLANLSLLFFCTFAASECTEAIARFVLSRHCCLRHRQ
jgi:hypothetical protein